MPTQPTLRPTNTDTQQNDTVCLITAALPAHTTFFPIPITTNAQVFLSHNCPRLIKKISKILESSHKPNTTVPILNKSKKSIQTYAITWMNWLQEAFYLIFPSFHFIGKNSIDMTIKTLSRNISVWLSTIVVMAIINATYSTSFFLNRNG